MPFSEAVEAIGRAIDLAGVAAIVLGIVVAIVRFFIRTPHDNVDSYVRFRQRVGRSILLGLELLVAADIVRTVAVAPTLLDVAVLGGIVLIRTFLSFSLELEVTGSWPWQKHDNKS